MLLSRQGSACNSYSFATHPSHVSVRQAWLHALMMATAVSGPSEAPSAVGAGRAWPCALTTATRGQ